MQDAYILKRPLEESLSVRRLQLLWSKSLEFLHDVCIIIELMFVHVLVNILLPNLTRTTKTGTRVRGATLRHKSVGST